MKKLVVHGFHSVAHVVWSHSSLRDDGGETTLEAWQGK